MIDALDPAAALAPAAAPIALLDDADVPAEPQWWQGLAEDVRFFLVCYLAGLLVFLVMLS